MLGESMLSWSAWRFWWTSVSATFICLVPHQRPKTAKRTSAELTLLKERSVWNVCDHLCFVAHFGRFANRCIRNQYFEFQCKERRTFFRGLAGRVFLSEGSSHFPPFLFLSGGVLGTLHGFSKYPFTKYPFASLWHLVVWECSIWRFWRFQFRPHTGVSGRLGITDQANTSTSATRPQDRKWSLRKEAWATETMGASIQWRCDGSLLREGLIDSGLLTEAMGANRLLFWWLRPPEWGKQAGGTSWRQIGAVFQKLKSLVPVVWLRNTKTFRTATPLKPNPSFSTFWKVQKFLLFGDIPLTIYK